jgi:hypothetical protein
VARRGAGADLGDAGGKIESLRGQIVMRAIEDLPAAGQRFARTHMDAGAMRVGLGDKEGLAEEALEFPRALERWARGGGRWRVTGVAQRGKRLATTACSALTAFVSNRRERELRGSTVG